MMAMSKKLVLVVIVLVCIIMQSCVSHRPRYKGEWSYSDYQESSYYTLYLIGDSGNAPLNQSTEVLDHLQSNLTDTENNGGVVWLGDNIYPVGLPPVEDPDRELAEHRIRAQLMTMDHFEGHKFFIPGNHDWYKYEKEGLSRQEKLVEDYLSIIPSTSGQKNFFIPDDGCGDPQIIPLTDSLSLLAMDTHWLLSLKAFSQDNSHCDVQDMASYYKKLTELIADSKDKTLIVVTHHPPYTYGHHGGKFKLKDDIFPMTQIVDWLYLPQPIGGYLFNRTRNIVSDQDNKNFYYKNLINLLDEQLQKRGTAIVASGHEHNLQYIDLNNQHYIVSGAGSKRNPAGIGKGTKFVIGEMGYVRLIFRDAKNVLMQYITPGLYKESNNVVYQKWLHL